MPRAAILRWSFLLAVVLCAAGPARAADWPTYRHDAARTGATEEAPPADPKVHWSLKLPALAPAWPDQERLRTDGVYLPVVLGDTVVVGSSRDDSVAAYDLKTGDQRWRFFTGGPVRVPPAGDGEGRVFVGSDDGFLYALNVKDGTLAWKVKGAPQHRLILGNGRLIDTWPVRGGPAVADGKVYFAAGVWPFMGVFLQCVDAKTGAVVWSNSGEGASYQLQPHSAAAFAGISPQGPLAVMGDKLVIPNGRAAPAVVERATGKPLYFPLNGKSGGDEVVCHDRYFFNGGIGFDWEKGKPAASVAGVPTLGSPVVGPGDELASFTDKGVFRVNAREPDTKPIKLSIGPKARLVPAATAELKDVRAMVRAGGRLVVGGSGWVGALGVPTADGKPPLDWKVTIDGTVDHLLVANGAVLAVTEEGSVYCLSAGDPPPGARYHGASPTVNVRAPADAAAEQQAALAVADAKATDGYALVAGPEAVAWGPWLAANTRLHIVVLEPDPASAERLRQVFAGGGLYGHRVAVVVGDLATAPLPQYFADLALVGTELPLPVLARLYDRLHPYHGSAYMPLVDRAALAALVARAGDRAATGSLGDPVRGLTKLARASGVPGAGNWANEHADAANTRVSADTVVKAPLGILWFGGSSNAGVLPRHGHGPQPQVVDGRCIVEGVDFVRATDIYTGRVLWEASLPGVGTFYDETLHQPGANGTGSNFVSRPDGIYVATGRECVVLDPATGKTLRTIPIPKGLAGGPDWVFSYVNVVGDYLVGGTAPVPKQNAALVNRSKPIKTIDPHEDPGTAPRRAITNPRTVGSKRIWVADRKTGQVLWSATAKEEFRHNAIAAGGGRLYAIDTPTTPTSTSLLAVIGVGGKDSKASPATQPATTQPTTGPAAAQFKGRLVAFDLATGKRVWEKPQAFGTWLSYSAEHDVLMEAGRYARDTLKDEPKGMRAWRAGTGQVLWHDPLAVGPAMIRGRWVLKEKNAADLITGDPIEVDDPVTGEPAEWVWARNYGCNTPVASQHLMTFRSGAAGFYDLARCGGTGNFGGFRSSCTNNLMVAGGLLVAPDYTRTCTCGYPIQTSVALVPDAAAEMWTFAAADAAPKGPVRRVGINLGAPGDRVTDDGTMWLEYPSVGGKSPKVNVKVDGVGGPGGDVRYLRRHATQVAGELPWVAASGATNVKAIEVTLNPGKKAGPDDGGGGDLPPADPLATHPGSPRYTVRLVFAQPPAAEGDRPAVADVVVQGATVDPGLDVLKLAGGPDRSLVRTYRGVAVGQALKVELKPAKGATVPVLCGVEVIRETPAAAASK
ncbi:MAG TPA: PQQ-binding-like beta-propeller repeat protein [Humisphaera sp.]